MPTGNSTSTGTGTGNANQAGTGNTSSTVSHDFLTESLASFLTTNSTILTNSPNQKNYKGSVINFPASVIFILISYPPTGK